MPMTMLQFHLHRLEASGLLEWDGEHGVSCVCSTCRRYWTDIERAGPGMYGQYLLSSVSSASPN